MIPSAWWRACGLLCLVLSLSVPAWAQSRTLSAPDSVPSGSKVPVQWTGPSEDGDIILIAPVGAPDDDVAAGHNDYTFGRSPRGITAPEPPGEYEIRFVTRAGIAARRPLQITPVTASLSAPATILAGNTVKVTVTGPRNESDLIGIVHAGAPDGEHPLSGNDYVFERKTVSIRAPEELGQYEIRYLRGRSGTTLASVPLTVTAVSASVKGPGKAAAGASFQLEWQGPGSEFDHMVIAPAGSAEDAWVANDYVFNRHPMTMTAPLAVGKYELRYQTGASGTTLARDPLEVTPGKMEPGLLRVTASKATLSANGAVEIILDASGSMLQRLGSSRRIDIAKQTLTHLTSSVIPAGTPFAMRVFGGEAGSCQSHLDIPLRPLEASAVGARVAALEVQSNAKTPIGASLESVAKDLSAVKGERVVILVTDGEETCGGNPARAIQKLRKGGTSVRVNIVGFAVEDAKLAATFRSWSIAGNGAYFNAHDEAGLNDALAAALRPAYEVVNAKKKVVADGLTGSEPIPLLPGTYTVSLKGQKGRSRRVTVQSGATTSADF
ncbi:MAG: hypothetical protein RL033_2362 [Pseudomonadota bacterium]